MKNILKIIFAMLFLCILFGCNSSSTVYLKTSNKIEIKKNTPFLLEGDSIGYVAEILKLDSCYVLKVNYDSDVNLKTSAQIDLDYPLLGENLILRVENTEKGRIVKKNDTLLLKNNLLKWSNRRRVIIDSIIHSLIPDSLGNK